MNLDAFLNNLHYDIDRASPPDWEVDWGDMPLPYKLYRDLPTVQLSSEVPLTFEKMEAKPTLETIGHFLWYSYGLNQVSQTMHYDPYTEEKEVSQSLRRYIPSGGGLYPNEIYLYVKVEGLTPGVYHYDVAHHRLICLREGNFDEYVGKALGERCDVSSCFATVFVSTMFWKNFFKYNNFGYRLQGLDAGVAIGQLQEVSMRYGYSSRVYYQYLDRPINHLLGLEEKEENVYAVIPLSEKPIELLERKEYEASGLCEEIPAIETNHYIHSKRVLDFPMIRKMNEAAVFESTESFSPVKNEERNPVQDGFLLPNGEPLSCDLAETCQMRYSPNMDFMMEKVPLARLATLLQETMRPRHENDVGQPRLSLYGCFYNIEGLPDGAYEYDSLTHSLRTIKEGDFRLQLQSGMSAHNVNLYQVPLCFHIVSDKDFGKRSYRIRHMEAGILLQRLLIAASALGWGGHPLLGFDVKLCDEIYQHKDQTCLLQIPVGPIHARSWLRGSLV